MTEEIVDTVLLNCTALLAETDGLIRNKSQLLDLLNIVLTEIDPARRDVLSDCLFPPTQRPFDLAWWQKLAWTIVFGAMLVVAIGGNVIVMWIVLAHRRMRTVTNYFLVNLSVSDILMSLLNCMFNFIFMVNSDWPFGVIYCTINNFVANVTVAASVFTLVAISVDRYMAIVRPLQHRTSRRRAGVVLVVIWVCSGLLAVPCILYSTTMTRRYTSGQTRKVCYMLWPDGRYPTSMTEYVCDLWVLKCHRSDLDQVYKKEGTLRLYKNYKICSDHFQASDFKNPRLYSQGYNLIFLAVTYLLPVTAMAVCYTIMGKALWGSRSIGELTHRQTEAIKCKKKVVRMFIFVVTIFAFCWLPYHGYFIYAYHDNSIASYKYVQHVYLAFYWLAMANAMVNPVIYYWMNNRFRVYFQKIICQCCCFRKKAKDVLELPSMKNNNSHWDLQRYKTDRTNAPQVLWNQRTKDMSHPHSAVPVHPNLIHASTAIIIGPIANHTHVF